MARRKTQNTNAEEIKSNAEEVKADSENKEINTETTESKLCRVMVINRFYDIRAEVTREVGEVFECTDERYTEIMQAHPHLVKKTNKKVGTQRSC